MDILNFMLFFLQGMFWGEQNNDELLTHFFQLQGMYGNQMGSMGMPQGQMSMATMGMGQGHMGMGAMGMGQGQMGMQQGMMGMPASHMAMYGQQQQPQMHQNQFQQVCKPV